MQSSSPNTAHAVPLPSVAPPKFAVGEFRMLHPRVQKYLNESGEKERLVRHLKNLIEDPYTSQSGVDIKKLQGRKHEMYRLRVGNHRFEYFVDDNVIWIDNAFQRGRGYR